MSRGSVRCLSLLVCVCFILSMLFSNILRVEASTPVANFTFNTVFYPNSTTDNTYGSISGGGGYLSNGSGSITSNSGSTLTNTHEGYSYHVSVPFTFTGSWSDIGGSGNYYDNSDTLFTMSTFFSLSSSTGTVSNVTLYYDNSIVYANGSNGVSRPVYYKKGSDMQAFGDSVFTQSYILEYDVAYEQQKSVGVTSSPMDSFTSTVSIEMSVWGRLATSSEIESAKLQVADSGTQQKLDTLNESTEAIEESVTSDTGGGILATIKNFFGSFFQNVFDTLVSVFVPEDGFFSDWFNRLNTLLSEKLGMLYAPFDLLITTLTAIMNADSTESGIPFPGIKWEDTWLVEPFTFTFSSLGDSFNDLREYVYFATDTVLLFAFLYLLQNKVRLILEGHESG